MPPHSTQNLNAKLSDRRRAAQRRAGRNINWKASPIRISGPPVRIVGAASSYRGGYRVDR